MFLNFKAAVAFAFFGFVTFAFAETRLLNASYDPTRELYKEINGAFAKKYPDIKVDTTHGGSGKQARGVIDGVEADVVTLALAYDIDAIATKAKLLPTNWQSRLPNNSSPYVSTIVFLVKKGNPKGIKDWDDLTKPNIGVITPNPKTSGGARWNFLAAYGYGLRKNANNDVLATEFVKKIYKNVLVLDSGARGATNTFAERGIGDVLIAWEDEALLLANKIGKDKFEVVYPSMSILAEPPVALVDKNVDKHNTRKQAELYLNYLYSKEAGEIMIKNYYRPTSKELEKDVKAKFTNINTFTIADFGGWEKAQKTFFANDGVFDKIFNKR